MDKKIVGVIGAITGLAAIDQVQAAPAATSPPDAMSARSYAALLDPIPNAVAALRAADAAAQSAAAGGEERGMQVAGMKHHHHSHHHHHHRVKKPPKPPAHHHHHHHFST